LSFMTESCLLGLAGGVVGVLSVLPVQGLTTGMVNWATFSENNFAIRLTPGLLVGGVALAALLGSIGGLFPAQRAARQSPALTLQRADPTA
ncbi:MAG TPA: ABC transporter permease, partial [Blastocatellia bacterium]|nr:ABC transporter permease [Blastocatellia bacterium]